MSEQKTQVRRGFTGAQVCNRITHFVTHFPTHLDGSAAAPGTLCAAQSCSRRQQLIGGYAFGLEPAPIDSTHERDRATPR